MTVKELKDELDKFEEDKEVLIDGFLSIKSVCDCVNNGEDAVAIFDEF